MVLEASRVPSTLDFLFGNCSCKRKQQQCDSVSRHNTFCLAFISRILWPPRTEYWEVGSESGVVEQYRYVT